MSNIPDSVRIDRWLWASRWFKTRPMAADAVKKGHIRLNQGRIKPAKPIRVGDVLTIKKNHLDFTLRVLDLSEKRLSAPLAQALYLESAESIADRQKASEQASLQRTHQAPSRGRPTKKDRRMLSRIKRSPESS